MKKKKKKTNKKDSGSFYQNKRKENLPPKPQTTKRKTNDLDRLIDSLSATMSGVKNFDKLIQDPKGKKLMMFFLTQQLGLVGFRSMFKKYHLPGAKTSIREATMDIITSKYSRELISMVRMQDLQENIQETLRLGYVGLFHKHESMMKGLMVEADEYFQEHYFDKTKSLNDYSLTEFNFKLVPNWKHSKTLNKVNWICNCIKHHDGYPTKKSPPNEFLGANKNKKISLNEIIFFADIDSIVAYSGLIFSLVITVGSFRIFADSILSSGGSHSQTPKFSEAKQAVSKMINIISEI